MKTNVLSTTEYERQLFKFLYNSIKRLNEHLREEKRGSAWDYVDIRLHYMDGDYDNVSILLDADYEGDDFFRFLSGISASTEVRVSDGEFYLNDIASRYYTEMHDNEYAWWWKECMGDESEEK